jgi:hypothetical protein
VLLMTPKVGEEKLLSGFANCGWLNALKNSARTARNGDFRRAAPVRLPD